MHVSRKMWQNNIAFPFNLQDEFMYSYSTLIKNNYFSYSLDTGGIYFFFSFIHAPFVQIILGLRYASLKFLHTNLSVQTQRLIEHFQVALICSEVLNYYCFF